MMRISYDPFFIVLFLIGFMSPAMAADSEENAPEPPACKYCPDDFGWSGWVEGGISVQDEDDYRFGRYNGLYDQGSNLILNGAWDYRDEDGLFVEATVSDLGLDSHRLVIEGGRQGLYELGFEIERIPNYRHDETSSPFEDSGEGQLGLAADWVRGATTSDMPELSSNLVRTPLVTERDRSGVRFSYYPEKNWEISGYIRREEKQGLQDIGATFGFSESVILPFPVDYTTDDIGLSLHYSRDKFQSQLNLTTSLFDNSLDAVSWQNPYEDAASDLAQGNMAGAPDNEFQQVSAIIAYQLQEKTRLSARLARGRMTQDAELLPYTINPSIATSALPVNSLDAQIDSTLASLQIVSQPADKLRLDASYSYSDRDNQTATNVYDGVTTDLAATGSRMNRPYSYTQKLLRLKADYRLPDNLKLSLGFDDDQMDRSYTNVEETQEQTLWGKFKAYPLDTLETTLKLSYSRRDASPFVALSDIDPLLDYPNSNYYNNELLRMHHMADRTRNKLGVELAYTTASAMMLGLQLDYFIDDYDEMYLGLQQGKGVESTASLSSMLSETLTTSMYYSYSRLVSDQQGSEKLLISDPENPWVSSDRNLSNTVGVSISWIAIEDELDIGAEFTYSDFSGEIEFENATDLPEISSILRAINVHGNYLLSKEMTVRFEYRYEVYEEDNWNQDGAVDTLPTLLDLGEIARDDTTSLAYVSLRYSF